MKKKFWKHNQSEEMHAHEWRRKNLWNRRSLWKFSSLLLEESGNLEQAANVEHPSLTKLEGKKALFLNDLAEKVSFWQNVTEDKWIK
jgi:hypothetical protein